MDAKCTSPKFIQEGQVRLRYDRDVILFLKGRVLSSDTGALYHIDLNEVAQRSSRGKATKQVSSSRSQPDRSRDTKSIILGPQKRTWNTGCHVSQSGSREINSSGRIGRSGVEYRTGDRHSKLSVEHKREYRNGARASNHRVDPYPDKEYKHNHSEEEPEWFSGGPSNVSETIELGGIVEGDGDCTSVDKPENSVVDNAEEVVVNLQSLCNSLTPCKHNETVANASAQKDSQNLIESPSSSINTGSRFKHLFSTTDGDTARDKSILMLNDYVLVENINQQLLRLLKGTGNASPNEQYKNNVIQIENKLRSLLFGHRLTADSSDHIMGDVECKAEKPKILTVEEIEAQLIQSSAPSQAPSLGICVNPTSESPANQTVTTHSSQTTDIPCCQSPLDTSLASLLQSLTSKQQAAKSSAVQGALKSYGIFSNPVFRLPTNALSASARINQLQQPEIGPTVLSESASGVLGNMLDTRADTRVGQNQTRLSPHSGFTCLNPESVIKPTTGMNALPLTMPVPRRPIVNSQLRSNSLALGLADIDRSISNVSTGQQMQAPGESIFYNHMSPNTYPLSPGFHDTSNISIGSTNNNSYFQQMPFCDRPQSENTLEFLSHLVEMDRSSVSFGHRKPAGSLNPLLPIALRAKTLEEIERQEVFHADTFL